MTIRVGILTISDRSYRGEREDISGPALVSSVEEQGWTVSQTGLLPDDRLRIAATLLEWCDSGQFDLILTTGGTGFSPRDITPEATLDILERQTPGIAEEMRRVSRQITPHAMLSRAVAGIRGKTIVINLPGSTKAAVECFQAVAGVLPHAVDLLTESPSAEAGHRPG
ncbi:MAG TPA: MogA/MoaB family molybdenum cofactor biosynthesis protein [Anaerolineaceae bacterium]|nr:MogA/MoaB family molybdenum cofactor biosynthesis protein [Anaerolineaceae bacterium]